MDFVTFCFGFCDISAAAQRYVRSIVCIYFDKARAFEVAAIEALEVAAILVCKVAAIEACQVAAIGVCEEAAGAVTQEAGGVFTYSFRRFLLLAPLELRKLAPVRQAVHVPTALQDGAALPETAASAPGTTWVCQTF